MPLPSNALLRNKEVFRNDSKKTILPSLHRYGSQANLSTGKGLPDRILSDFKIKDQNFIENTYPVTPLKP
jgi:hypothetical protein